MVTAGLAGSAPAAAATQPLPRFAHTVVLRPISGRVLIHTPSGPVGFVRLRAERAVPVGTVVDTTVGRVSLTSANPISAPVPRQTGQFFGGIFQVRQNPYLGGLVNLVIRDNVSTVACTPAAAHSAALSPTVLGLLRGVAKGHFRTTGRFAAATVRGTDWGVRNRCDGTLTVVRRGTVVVRDFVRHKTVVLHTGQTYLAEAP
jgi:hypothetical protein